MLNEPAGGSAPGIEARPSVRRPSFQRGRSRLTALLAPAWRPWLTVHLLVLTALALVLAVHAGDLPRAGSAPDAVGLFGWDAGWYRSISEHGYDGTGSEALRFFPLLPLLGRAVPGIGSAAGMLTVVSICCLLYLAAVAVLTRVLTGDEAAARRAPWVAALVPGATALVLPYTESLAGLAAAVLFLVLLRGSGAAGAAAGFLAGVVSGLVRPTGLVLVLPALVVALLSQGRRRVALVSAAGPLAGTGLFLGWSGLATGRFLGPYQVQSDETLRGGLFVNPLPGVLADKNGGISAPATFALMAVGVVLVVLVLRTLPVALGLWSVVTLVLSVSSIEAHSLPRYLAGIIPIVVVLAARLRPGWSWRSFVVLSAILSFGLTVGWLNGTITP